MNQSVSWGTLRSEYLIPVFVDVLDDIRASLHEDGQKIQGDITKSNELLDEARKLSDYLKLIELNMDLGDDYYDSQEAYDDLQDLIMKINEYTPEGVYFGCHPGDGADFGFWSYNQD